MILHRIVEHQSQSVVRQLTDSQEEFEFIESLIETTKPAIINSKHHYLIKTPFRYPLPVEPQFQERFKPPYFHKNCLYASEHYQTAAFEYAFHWLKQRIHIKNLSHQTQPRTHFQIKFHDPQCLNITKHKNIKRLMNRSNYSASHDFILKHSDISSLKYPSCRDPQQRPCLAVFDINTLDEKIHNERTILLIYNQQQKKCRIETKFQIEEGLDIFWHDVA